MARTRARRSSGCRDSMCGTAGVTKVLAGEEAMALGGVSSKCPTASCPAYTSVVVFLAVLYLFFVACNYTFRPGFMRKAGSSATDANNLSLTSAFLYALLWTGLVLVAIALIMRCRNCM